MGTIISVNCPIGLYASLPCKSECLICVCAHLLEREVCDIIPKRESTGEQLPHENPDTPHVCLLIILLDHTHHSDASAIGIPTLCNNGAAKHWQQIRAGLTQGSELRKSNSEVTPLSDPSTAINFTDLLYRDLESAAQSLSRVGVQGSGWGCRSLDGLQSPAHLKYDLRSHVDGRATPAPDIGFTRPMPEEGIGYNDASVLALI